MGQAHKISNKEDDEETAGARTRSGHEKEEGREVEDDRGKCKSSVNCAPETDPLYIYLFKGGMASLCIINPPILNISTYSFIKLHYI
jgi:hypothetical protein